MCLTQEQNVVDVGEIPMASTNLELPRKGHSLGRGFSAMGSHYRPMTCTGTVQRRQ
jgi:hypothetical protein